MVAKSAVIYLFKVQQVCEWNMHKLSCLQPLPTHLCLKSLILTLICVELNLISFSWCLFFGESFYVLLYTELSIDAISYLILCTPMLSVLKH